MATWRELFEDFESDTLTTREKLVVTPRQFMRWAADGLSKAQRRCKIVDNLKTLTASGGSYGIGDDVLEILMLVGADGMEILMTTQKQHQMIGDQEPLGLNEVPYNFSLKRNNPYLANWGPEARLAKLDSDYRLHIMPDPATDVTMRYVMDFHRFSSSSSQWDAWFVSDDDFETLFATTGLAPEMAQYDEAIAAYVLMKYYRQIHNQDWVIAAQEWKDALATIQNNKQTFYYNGTAPYNMAPYQ